VEVAMSKLKKQSRKMLGKRDPNCRKGYFDSFSKGPNKHVERFSKASPKK
jgi:hypothetical protein